MTNLYTVRNRHGEIIVAHVPENIAMNEILHYEDEVDYKIEQDGDVWELYIKRLNGKYDYPCQFSSAKNAVEAEADILGKLFAHLSVERWEGWSVVVTTDREYEAEMLNLISDLDEAEEEQAGIQALLDEWRAM